MECLSVAELTNQLQNIFCCRIFQSSKNKLTNKLTGATCITVEKSLEHNVEKNKSHRNTRSRFHLHAVQSRNIQGIYYLGIYREMGIVL